MSHKKEKRGSDKEREKEVSPCIALASPRHRLDTWTAQPENIKTLWLDFKNI